MEATVDRATHINRIAGLTDINPFGNNLLNQYPIENTPPTYDEAHRISTQVAIIKGINTTHTDQQLYPSFDGLTRVIFAHNIAHDCSLSEANHRSELIADHIASMLVLSLTPEKAPDLKRLTHHFFSEMPITKPRMDESFIKGWLYAKKYRLHTEQERALIAVIDLLRTVIEPAITVKVSRFFSTYDDHYVLAPSIEEAKTIIQSQYDRDQLADNAEYDQTMTDPPY